MLEDMESDPPFAGGSLSGDGDCVCGFDVRDDGVEVGECDDVYPRMITKMILCGKSANVSATTTWSPSTQRA